VDPPARGPAEHPFAREAADPPDALIAAGVRIFYSKAIADELAATGATAGRLPAPTPDSLGVSADAAAYGCGLAPFMAEAHGALVAAGRLSACPPLARTGPDECRVWPFRRAGDQATRRASSYQGSALDARLSPVG
jgi:hypothetical protein